jgi:hypothetical protein
MYFANSLPLELLPTSFPPPPARAGDRLVVIDADELDYGLFYPKVIILPSQVRAGTPISSQISLIFCL